MFVDSINVIPTYWLQIVSQHWLENKLDNNYTWVGTLQEDMFL